MGPLRLRRSPRRMFGKSTLRSIPSQVFGGTAPLCHRVVVGKSPRKPNMQKLGNICLQSYTGSSYNLGHLPQLRDNCWAFWAHLGFYVWRCKLVSIVYPEYAPFQGSTSL